MISFNAATAVTPWRQGLIEQALGEIEGFNAATAVTPWRPRRGDPMEFSGRYGFNAATAVTPWRPRTTIPGGIISI